MAESKSIYTTYPRVPKETIVELRKKLNKEFKEYIASLPSEDIGLKQIQHTLDKMTNKIENLKKQITTDLKQKGRGKYKSKSKKKRVYSHKRKSHKKRRSPKRSTKRKSKRRSRAKK
jgi:hypothetical protein